MNDETNEVQCSVFQQHENRIKSITMGINSQKKLSDKGPLANELCNEAEILMTCKDYEKNEPDCINCHTISALRKRTAGLVLKAGIVLDPAVKNDSGFQR